MDIERFYKLVERIRKWFNGRNYEQYAEDAVQEYAVYILEGKSQHQTIDQFCIDFMRRRTGRKGKTGFEQQKNLEFARVKNLAFFNRISKDPWPLVDSRFDLRRSIRRVRDSRSQAFLNLMAQGWRLHEIGEKYGITESRVSQIVMAATGKMRMDEENRLDHINKVRQQMGLKLLKTVKRKCLRCDRTFEATVNRMCEVCRKYS